MGNKRVTLPSPPFGPLHVFLFPEEENSQRSLPPRRAEVVSASSSACCGSPPVWHFQRLWSSGSQLGLLSSPLSLSLAHSHHTAVGFPPCHGRSVPGACHRVALSVSREYFLAPCRTCRLTVHPLEKAGSSSASLQYPWLPIPGPAHSRYLQNECSV